MLEIPYRRGRREECVLQPETREEYEAAIGSSVRNLVVTQDQLDEWGIHPEIADVEPDEAMDLLFGSDEQYWERVLLPDGDGDSTVETDSGLSDAPASVGAAAGE